MREERNRKNAGAADGTSARLVDKAENETPSTAGDEGASLLWHQDTFELLRAYRNIENAAIRRHVLDIIKAAATACDDN